MFKKIAAIIIACLLLTVAVSAETTAEQKPEITASAYVLYNPDNSEVVDSKNLNTKMFPASLTKMLTALTVLDLCEDLDNEVVTVSDNAITSLYATQSSTAKIKIGEKFTVKQLLYLMLMRSGNDAANALAEHFCKSNLAFAEEMNNKAKQIGMLNSNFCNPHGLHDDNHYTTAYDLAILASHFSDDKLLYKIAQTIEYTLPQTNLQAERVIRTTNNMLVELSGYYYQYATGLKTGNTDNAGRCLAACAEKDGKKFICILLDVPKLWDRNGLIRTDFLEAAKIFKYAFSTYKTIEVAKKGDFVKNVPVFETFSKTVDLVLSEDVYATLPKGTDISNLNIEFKSNEKIENGMAQSPVSKGDILGSADLILANKVIGTCNVVANQDVSSSGIIVLWHTIDLYVYILASVIAFVILLIVILVVRKKIILYKRKKAKEKRLERRRRMFEEFQKQEPIDYFKMD